MRRIPQSLARTIGIWAGLIATLSLPCTLLAQSVVTECTHAELATRIAEARDLAGDGLVTFDCDGVIVLTNTIVLPFSLIEIETDGYGESITNETELLSMLTLDGTGRFITISGPTVTNITNGVRLFLVDSGVTLAVTNINFANGLATNGAAIFVRTNGALLASGCAFSNNVAVTSDGLDGTNPRTNTVDGVAKDGGSGKSSGLAAGGAVYNLGFSQFVQCSFLTNAAISGNGGAGGNGGNGTVSAGDGGNGGKAGQALGGAIYNQGDLGVFSCQFFSNFAGGGSAADGGAAGAGPFAGLSGHGGPGGSTAGGAVHNHLKSHALVVNSTFAFNAAASGNSSAGGANNGRGKKGPAGPNSSGGAIANLGTNELINCSFFANTVTGGGGGDGGPGTVQGGNGGSGGSAYGGNVFNGGKRGLMLATNCTFSDGGATPGTNGLAGSGAFAAKDGAHGVSRAGNVANSNGVFHLKNCVIAYASPGTNGYGKFKDAGFNLSSDRSIKLNTKLGSITNRDPRLDVLRANGGPVETLELLSGSPAIDAGDTNFVLTTDARGVGRPIGPRGDIGAYEAGVTLGPPRITTQPVSQIAREDARITFSVVAQGDPPLLYQWRKDGDDLTGETSAMLIIDPVTDDDDGEYEVVISNNSGSVTSEMATLTVVHAPEITEDPESGSVNPGGQLVLSVTAEGDATLVYSWYTNGVLVSGATLNTFTIDSAQAQDALDYQAIVCNPYGCATSAIASVTVAAPGPPVISSNPASTNVFSGENAVFRVTVTGSLPFRYQWYFNTSTPLPGATNATVAVNGAQPGNAGTYHVVITNIYGSATSAPATLTVSNSAPVITAQPADSDNVNVGDTIVLTVTAVGSTPLAYQWYQYGLTYDPTNDVTVKTSTNLLLNATNSILTLTNIQAEQEGVYQVNVTNAFGGTFSSEALVLIIGVGVP
jgi:hypothetical protein